MSDRSEEEEQELQKATYALRAKTFAKAFEQEKARLPQEPLDAANRAIEEGFKAQNFSGTEQPSSPETKSSGAIREAVERGRLSPSYKPPGSPLNLTPPVEEWTEEDHEFARLALAALGIEPEPSPPSDAQILETMTEAEAAQRVQKVAQMLASGQLKRRPSVPEEETEEDGIRAEAIRRSMVRQGIYRGQSQSLSPSQSDTPETTASPSSDKPSTPDRSNHNPRATSLLRDPSELSAAEIAHWDTLAANGNMPDAQSCASAWQISGLAHSRRVGAPIVLRQSGNSQIAFAVTETFSGWRLGPLEAHWHFGCPLIGPDAVELLADVTRELRLELQTEAIEIVVSGLDPKGALAKQIDAGFANGLMQKQDPHAAASLEGGIEGWLSRRSSNFRRNLKRAERRALAGGIWFERAYPASAIDADRCYERMLAVEQKSWKGPRRQGLLAVRAFYQSLLRAYAERGAARVVFAKQADEDVGFCFGGASHGVYRGQQTSFRDDLAGFSIGTLMHFEKAKWLAEDGARLQHFGPIQRMMSYKYSLCENELSSVLSVFRG